MNTSLPSAPAGEQWFRLVCRPRAWHGLWHLGSATVKWPGGKARCVGMNADVAVGRDASEICPDCLDLLARRP